MKRSFRSRMPWLAMLVVLGLILAACGSGSSPPASASTEPMKIGATLPLSGSLALYTEQFKKGLDLAVEDLNAKGVSGRKIQLLYEDTKSEPKDGVAALRKLIDLDKVPVAITIFTGIGLAQLPIADQAKMVLISGGIQHPEFTSKSDWTFSTATNPMATTRAIADLAVKKLNLKKHSFIHINDAWGAEAVKLFKENVAKAGGQVLATDAYELKMTDFRSQITRLLAPGPEAVSVFGTGGKEVAFIIKQIREMGFKGQLLANNGVEAADLFNVAGSAAENIIYVIEAFNPERATPAQKQFIDRFVATYKIAPDFFALNHYDLLMIVAKAIEANGYNADGIRKALLATKDYKGLTGTITFNKDGSADRELIYKVTRGGRFMAYEN